MNDNRSYWIREMMFGTKDVFEYVECAHCGCLQLVNIPKDIAKYYPPDYYSYNEMTSIFDRKIKKFIKQHRFRYYLLGKSDPVGLLASWFFKIDYLMKIKPVCLSENSKILDIGCGAGRLLINLRKDGFKYLTGIDPFINSDIFYANGVNIYKKTVYEINDTFDFIMLNHSFEHMDKPFELMIKLRSLLNPDGMVLINTPMADSWAWKHYRENWRGIEAPRHFFIHTRKSMETIAQATGFFISDVIYTSSETQFLGSEQNQRNVPQRSNISYYEDLKKSIFSPADVRKFKKMARRLNRQKEGDEACFYLKALP